MKRNNAAHSFKREFLIAIYGIVPFSYIVLSVLARTLFPGDVLISIIFLSIITVSFFISFFEIRRHLSPKIINGRISGGLYPLYLKMDSDKIILHYLGRKRYPINLRDVVRMDMEPMGRNQRWKRLRIRRKDGYIIEIIVDGEIAAEIAEKCGKAVQIDVFGGMR